MRRSLNTLLGLLLASLCSAASLAEPIKIFGDENYPPVIYLDAQQQPTGVLVEVLHQFERATGETLDLQLYPWKRAYVSAEYAKGGVIGVSKTAPRELAFDFSEPIYNDDINVVVHKGREFPFTSLSDLHGKKIGAQSGASYGAEADIAIESQLFEVERDQSQVSRLRKLLHGRIDAAFIGNGHLGLSQLLDDDPELKAHRDEFVILSQPLTRDALYLAFSKSLHMQDFLTRFNQVMREARASQSASTQPAAQSN